jgi:hypothetical protein
MLFWVLVMSAETQILTPTDDMYSDTNHPGTDPTITELWTANFPTTSNYQRIMIRFELQDLAEKKVESATLHLTRFLSCPSGGTTATHFYAINSAWTESSWDYTQHISYNEDTAMPYVFSGTGGNAIVHFQVDISTYLDKWLKQELPNNGIVIISDANQKFSKFYSKEHSNEEYRPYLSVTYSSSSNSDLEVPVLLTNLSNYPNPFCTDTNISFTCSKVTEVLLKVFNIRGQLVCHLPLGRLATGKHTVSWQAVNARGIQLPKGIYYYQVSSPHESHTARMIIK